MGAPVSSFTRALRYQLALRAKTHRQIARVFGELETTQQEQKAIASLESSAPAPRINRASLASTSVSSSKSSYHRESRTQRADNDVERVVRSQTEQITPDRNRVDVEYRNRKEIANTQADKHGREAANMTSLATSGIDGKGLRINRIR